MLKYYYFNLLNIVILNNNYWIEVTYNNIVTNYGNWL